MKNDEVEGGVGAVLTVTSHVIILNMGKVICIVRKILLDQFIKYVVLVAMASRLGIVHISVHAMLQGFKRRFIIKMPKNEKNIKAFLS